MIKVLNINFYNHYKIKFKTKKIKKNKPHSVGVIWQQYNS